MRKTFVYFLATLCLIGLTACGGTTSGGGNDFGAMKTGIQVSDDQMAQVIDKKTTAEEVVRLIGHPGRQAQVGEKEMWYYDYTQIGHVIVGGRNVSETTVFEINKRGVVISHYKTSGSGGTSSNPLLKAAGQ